MKLSKFISNFDYIIFLATIFLTIIGLFFIYSSVLNTSIEIQSKFSKQIFFSMISLILLVSVLFVPTKSFKSVSIGFYIFCLLGLLVTIFLFYEEVKGQKRFSIFGFSFQFSELTKIAIILLLSKFYSEKSLFEIQKISIYIKSILIIIPPAILILLQPDLGTILVFIPILLTIAFMAGVKKRYILYTILLICFVTFIPVITTLNKIFFNNNNKILLLFTTFGYVVFIFGSLSIILIISIITYYNIIPGIGEKFKKIFYWMMFVVSAMLIGLFISYPTDHFVLKSYQKDRLLIFFNPNFDPKKSGYNIIQSKNTIGNGGFFGKGWCKGEQTQKKFLPEQETDFIFAVIAEETGFIGSILVLFLYSLLFYRGFFITLNSKNYFEGYVSAGILAMLLFHIIQNIGMTIGIMPITGVPLPFLSYGGSFLITCFLGIGILMNIELNRYQY